VYGGLSQRRNLNIQFLPADAWDFSSPIIK
jgi:hypothetical protein